MARDVAAVYVDDSAIRVLAMGGRRPRQWASTPLDAGMVKEGYIVDEEGVARKTRDVLASAGIGSRRVIAGISGINCLFRYITLPELPRNLLPEAVTREASRAFGVPTDELYISWQDLPSKPGETLVYVVGASRATVDGIIRTLRKAGLNPYMMDIAPVATCRAAAETNALIVDLQSATLDIVVKMDGLPEVVRSVSVPRADSASANLQTVRQELQRAVTFYNSSHPDTPIADSIPILVGGMLASEPDLWPELLGRAERRIDAVAPPVDEAQGLLPAEYLVPIGLALKESQGKGTTPYARINFNALPPAYQPKPRPLSDLLYPPVLIAGVACLMLGGYYLMNEVNQTRRLADEATLTSELALSLGSQLSGDKQSLEAEQASLSVEADAKESRTAELDARFRSYDTIKDAVNGDLGEIHKTPASVDLQAVNHTINVIVVSGWSDTEASAFGYARQLRSSGRFSHVVITEMSLTEVETWFTIVLFKD